MPLTAREAIKLVISAGGKLERHGGKHDIYTVNGIALAIPRHKGDLSPGVEKQVREALNMPS